ncbi:MAG: M42 family metallopeptidase [Mycoplasmatales bacterium]
MYGNKEIERLINAKGPSGFEQNIVKIIKDIGSKHWDKTKQDKLGSLITIKDNKASYNLMLAAHMDEVGFIVKKVDKDGFVFIEPVGGWITNTMLSQAYIITTKTGKEYRAISGSVPPHVLTQEQRKKPVLMEDIYLDLGVESKDEVDKMGIEVGNMITPDNKFEVLNNKNYLSGKAFDDRIGCAILLSVQQELSKVKNIPNIYGTFTAQEETGLKGAKTASTIIPADLAISIDTGVAGSLPGMTKAQADNKLGNGPLLMVLDSGHLAHPKFRKHVQKVAKKHNIPYQPDFIAGSQDGSSITKSRAGVPSIAISIPTRYIHSHVSVIHKEDYKNAVKLIVEVIKTLDDNTIKEIKS